MSTAFFPKNPNNVIKSRSDARSFMGVCPLMKSTVQLVPLRYGLVDNPMLDPSAEVTMPFALSARPLGIRLLRDGWLYVIEGSSGLLSEYRVEDGLVSAMLWQGQAVVEDEREAPIHLPSLIFAKSSTVHVAYAEVQWTAKKCHQVLDDPGERDHFMQAVDLSAVDCETGAPHLLTYDMAEHWLAEAATEQVEAGQHASSLDEQAESTRRRMDDALPEHERQPYVWERPQRFEHVSMNRLTACIDPHYRDDTLYLVLDDTLGVLRDLANYQDQVIGWIDDWASGGAQKGDNERDYLLACYIESLSQMSESDLSALANTSDDLAINALFADLERLPDSERRVTQAALRDYLNKGGLMLPPAGSAVPEALADARAAAQEQAARSAPSFNGGLAMEALGAMEDVDRRYFTREHFRSAPAAFVDSHFEALVALGKQQHRQIDDILHGSKLGQRGVNDLIDRDAMDRELTAHRAGLARWNLLLDRITADRVALVTGGAFHKAAWYFDPLYIAHARHAFTLEYACLKDICRSDEACDQLFDYIEREPQFSRPLYYTLPFSEQTALWVQYAFLSAAGLTLFNNGPELLARMMRIEQGRLPVLDDLPESTRIVVNAAQHTLTPALNRGLELLLASFEGLFDGKAIPDVDDLLRRLPTGLKARLLVAAKTEGVTFKFASTQELVKLRSTLQELAEQLPRKAWLKKERGQSNRLNGHKSPKSQALMAELHELNRQIEVNQRRLAASMSPIPELPDYHERLYGATPGRAGLTAIFPPEGRQQVAGLMENFRKGITSAPPLNVLGDGAALLLFVAQAVNLVQVIKEIKSKNRDEQAWSPLVNAAVATGAVGFAAAQGIFDTALSAQAKVLQLAMNSNNLSRLQVWMGKLHVGLGIATYFLGFVSAAISLDAYRSNWVQAVRSGNRAAQHSAIVTMVAAGGLMLSNAYGFNHTFYSGYLVLKAAKGEARRAAWRAAGQRLSRVFFRSSPAGGLFTILELAGTWLYNRYNLSARDKWLQCTPWGREADKRKAVSFELFQLYLQALLQAPFVQIKGAEEEPFWRSLLLTSQPGEVFLVFPGLSRADFQATLQGTAWRGLLIGAQRTTTLREGSRGLPLVRREDISAEVEAGLSRVVSQQEREGQGSPLALTLRLPRNPERASALMSEEIVLELVLQTLDEDGEVLVQTYCIRFNPRETGRFPATEPSQPSPGLPLLAVHILELEEVVQ